MKCLVTGGAGFIGSNLSAYLVENGHEVKILDNLYTGNKENLSEIINDVEFIEDTFLNPEACARAVKGVEAVFHQGAIPSVPRSIANPVATNEANVSGTLNMMIAARDAGVRRFVCASSSSVYGDTPTLPKVETMATAPKSIYAASKLICEHYAHVFSKIFKLETVCLRYFNVFGPKQDPASQYAAVIPKFIKMINAGENPTVHGDGLQTRDFSYIENVIQANVLAGTVDGIPENGLICNIACGERFSLLDLIDNICDILGKKVEPVFEDSRPGDVKDSLADISVAKKVLGYDPKVNFRQGLEKTAPFYLK